MLKIALCSPGLTRQDTDARSVGLDFLARLIHQRYTGGLQLFTIAEKDVPLLTGREVDFLLVSVVGSGSALAYAKAVRYKKPPVFTAIGGPAMLFPAAFRDLADVIMLGRGEDAIFRLLAGDFRGMMRRDSSLNDNEVEWCRTSLLSPGQLSVGCPFRCAFCSYSWLHTFASSDNARSHEYTSNKVAGNPSAELMFKDVKFSMLKRSPFKRCVSGLDVTTPLDVRLIKKPVSFALIRSVFRHMAKDAAESLALPGLYQMRLFTVTAYPWNADPCDLHFIQDAAMESASEFPDGVSVFAEVSLNHFIPQIGTPLECCAVCTENMRKRFASYYSAPRPKKGAFIDFDKFTVPSPMQAVQQAVLMRTAEPGLLPIINAAKSPEELASWFPEYIGWQDKKPAPWIRRNNDNSKRVATFYKELYELTPLRPPIPTGYEPFESEPDIFGVPVADFGKNVVRNTRTGGVSKSLFDEL